MDSGVQMFKSKISSTAEKPLEGGGYMCVHTSNCGSRVSEDVSSVPTGGVKIPGKNKENKIPEVRLAAYINCASADTLDSQTQRLGFV